MLRRFAVSSASIRSLLRTPRVCAALQQHLADVRVSFANRNNQRRVAGIVLLIDSGTAPHKHAHQRGVTTCSGGG